MTDVPENELLSAYLDGELTAEEQAQVERLLEASPAARQLVDELRALSTSLGDLPSHQIGEDISGRVLRRAERQMLADPGAALPSRQAPDQPAGPRWRAIARRVARPRTLVWSGVAVAVALLLMLADPAALRQTPDRSVATRSPADEERFEAFPSMQASPATGEVTLAEKEEFPGAKSSEGESAPDRSDVVLRKGSLQQPAETPATAGAPPATPPVEAMAESPAPTEPAKGGMRGMGGGQAGFGYAAHDRAAGEYAAKRGSVAGPTAGRPQRAERQPSMVVRETAPPSSAAGAAPSASPAPEQPRPDVPAPEASLVVLRYNVTADAVRRGVFHKLLESQHITELALASAAQRGQAQTEAAAGDVAQRKYEFYSVAGKPGHVINVDIEATRDQIEALLGELHRRPEQFSLISYVPAPGAGSARYWSAQGPGAGPSKGHSVGSAFGAVQSPQKPEDAPQKQLGDTVLDELLLRARQGGSDKKGVRRAEMGQPDTPVERHAAGPSVRRRVAKEGEKEEEARPAKSLSRPGEPSATAEGGRVRRDLAQQSLEPQPMPAEEAPEMEDMRAGQSAGLGVKAERLLEATDTERTLARPSRAKQPSPPTETDKLGRAVTKYRVRFEMQVVDADRPDVAASATKVLAEADAAMEEAPPEAAKEAGPAEMPAAARAIEPAKPEP